jgi:ATP-dependent DNA helicase RecG
MTALELQCFLLERYPRENESVEWKAASSLKSFVSGKAGEDLLSYVSAFANVNGGHVVMGAQDQTLSISGIQRFEDYTAESLPPRLLGNLTNMPSMGLRVEELVATDTLATVWVLHIPKHEPRKPVYAHKKAWQRYGDTLAELHADRLNAILSEPLKGDDWSAQVVEAATLDDLDPDALKMARRKFADKHQMQRWSTEIPHWSDAEFLDKARISRNGQLTNAAMLLLGRSDRQYLLSPHPAEISWKLPEERVVEHFGPPFLLTTTEVLRRIRNPNIKLFPATELIATEMPRYDAQVILESLHNCVAHQDYDQNARIVVEEFVGRLAMHNVGGFADGTPEEYFKGARTPSVYRNKWLADAMNLIGMIDRGGFGIRDMVLTQRKRFLPLPDYDGSTGNKTIINIYGQTIDENYSHLLMQRAELPIEEVVWLDRVQKKQLVSDEQIKLLRSKALIEGRRPNFTVSAKIAAATRTENKYVLDTAFDDDHYKRLIVKRLKVNSATGAELRELLIDKLPALLSSGAKESKIKNLRTALRVRGIDGAYIEVDPSGPQRGPGAIWRIRA